MTVKVKDYMYGCVDRLIDEYSDELGLCKCNSCKSDIMAITLNKLGYCKYEACEEFDEEKINNIIKEKKDEILDKIKEANAIVSKNPRHDDTAQKIEPKNYMEMCSCKTVETLMKQKGYDMSKLDEVIAMTLNYLPVKYIVSHKGELFSKINTLQTQFQVDILSAAIKALENIK